MATLAPLLMLASQTDARALAPPPGFTAFPIIGLQWSSTPDGCGSGVTHDSFAGWGVPVPTSGTTPGWTLDLCRTALPASGSIPIFGYSTLIISIFPQLLFSGHITFLGEDVSGNSCTFHYALDFSAGAYSTTTPESVGFSFSPWPPGAIRLDYGGCNLATATGSVGGQVQVLSTPLP